MRNSATPPEPQPTATPNRWQRARERGRALAAQWRSRLARTPRRHLGRYLQLAGLSLALLGFVALLLDNRPTPTTLTSEQRELLGLAPGERPIGFLIAGRDRLYLADMSTPIYGADGAIVGWNYQGPRGLDGTNTDTILYALLIGNRLTLIAIPRDIYFEAIGYRINTIYALEGTEGLRRAVEGLVGLPVDHHVIINLDVFKNLVDALGGVEVNVPYAMRYVDRAGGLDINLLAGVQRLDGKNAADFVRFRETIRGDYDRIDRIKTLAYAMLARVRELGLRSITVLPDVVDTLIQDIETDVPPTLAAELLPRLANLQLEAATLPTVEFEGVSRLYTDPQAIASFLALTFGGVTRTFTEAPAAPLHILDRSGIEGLGQVYFDEMVRMGVPRDKLLLSSASRDPAGTRLLAVNEQWSAAHYYAELLNVGTQQIDRLPSVQGRAVGMQLLLGPDAIRPNPAPDLLLALEPTTLILDLGDPQRPQGAP